MVLLLGMAAAASIAQSQPLQFDLVCSGTMTGSFPITGKPPIVTPVHERLRVDLPRRLWCRDGCRQTYAMGLIDAKELRFDTGPPPPGDEAEMKFDYGSGVLSDRMTFGPGNPVLTRSERCDIVPPSEPIP
jgi:hypothetical protein